MHPYLKLDAGAFGTPVCRFGLAARGNSRLAPDDVHVAIEQGVNFLNWYAESEGRREPDGLAQAIASLGKAREAVVVCVQMAARTASEAARELRSVMATLATDYLDVVTCYYVEQMDEWDALIAPDGALTYCRQLQRDGVVRRIGLTTHQRLLAAAVAGSGSVDTLMIRYNAAHRGAETEVFPVTHQRGIPVIAYTALRWGALLRSTPDDPADYVVAAAPEWYRFVLDSEAVSVVLAAPRTRAELDEDLRVLSAEGRLPAHRRDALAEHGQRVRMHGGAFP